MGFRKSREDRGSRKEITFIKCCCDPWAWRDRSLIGMGSKKSGGWGGVGNETEYKQLFQEALLLRRNWALAGERMIQPRRGKCCRNTGSPSLSGQGDACSRAQVASGRAQAGDLSPSPWLLSASAASPDSFRWRKVAEAVLPLYSKQRKSRRYRCNSSPKN